MSKPITITLSINDYLDKAFKTLPANAIIHKGRCGIGGTTLEINANRCSIIVVPTRGIIEDKCHHHPDLFAVKGKGNGQKSVTVEEIATYLCSDAPYKKFITTPDSFEKIIMAARSIEKEEELYNDYFLLMDESHSAATESFREKILLPFKHLWCFDKKTFISATPYKFSDLRFDSLQRYEIKFKEPFLGKVKLVKTEHISECVDFYIRNANQFPGNLFFFYNSVTEISEAITRNNITNCNIYCADKEEHYEKLDDNLSVFQQQPRTGQFNTINFFTTRYFEGWDLIEENATLILVTDIHKAHTKVGISNKGVQAVGRSRKAPHQIIHITNHREKREMKTLDQFKKEYHLHTKKLIHDYNSYIEECRNFNIEPLAESKDPIKRFADFDDATQLASLNTYKLDQILNELACNEEFNDGEFIKQAWEKALYQVEIESFTSSNKTSNKRKSKATLLKELIEVIENLEQNKEQYVMNMGSKKLDEIQSKYSLAFDAYYVLGKDKLEELKYNEKAIECALIETHNISAESKLLAYLSDKIVPGGRYTIEEIVKHLQFGYNLYRIRDPKTGKVRKASASQIKDPGRYMARKAKKEVNGKLENAYLIEKALFTVAKAA